MSLSAQSFQVGSDWMRRVWGGLRDISGPDTVAVADDDWLVFDEMMCRPADVVDMSDSPGSIVIP
ncbi:MAG: hypothetical protein LBV06_00905 [Propionibacteriaceae bacterium]|jgi:hypothetical protein|nr:hypothetical protein [Propionibacteriaceae bacterium]